MDEESARVDVDSISSRLKGRQRFFEKETARKCWEKADVVPGRHPERWRKDVAGNVVCRKFRGCEGCLCFQLDHIHPFTKGGETDVSNCQVLQSRVNRYKGDKVHVDDKELQQSSCNLKFTDKELDVIEMAVYGDVIRPGLQCKCKSIKETLGIAAKKKGPVVMSCELPSQKLD
ncbi:hypothetical protein KP509_03G060500 [Ceratopteris richardii]|uniref:HNH domain-containing protein n=1 Tax=Ceratopteris richardii TaxID=49495 RepID=A0A8T2V7U3_CERRI|nr:hypothetical protein KP509_1Z270600 [Ceratopteris richardii]KAH7441883.1 hypothetical protein KP509_03G060500 [Ceratopteris richardii]